MMQQEIGVSEETTKSTQQAGFMCLCHTHTTGNSSYYGYRGNWQKLNSCKVAAFKEKTQFCLIKNLILYLWCFIAQLDVRLKESSLFPPCSCPHGCWPRLAPWPSSSITIRSPPCLSFLCQLLGQAIRSCQGTTASFPNPGKINAVGLNQSFCNVTQRKQKRNPAIKQSSLHTVYILFTAMFLRAIVFLCCAFTLRQPSLSVGVKTKREITPVKGEKWSNQVEMTSPRLACTLNNSCASGAIRR